MILYTLHSPLRSTVELQETVTEEVPDAPTGMQDTSTSEVPPQKLSEKAQHLEI